MKDFWKKRIKEHINVIDLLFKDREILNNIEKAAETIVGSYQSGGKLLICGNGGSAADAQHIATELVSKLLLERPALDAEALTVNTSSITGIGNDYNFDRIFARQIEGKGKKGDVLLAISTSGNSKNVIEAIKTAKGLGIITIGLTGKSRKSLIFEVSDHCICIPSDSVPRIQEAHIFIGHMLCEFVEKELFR